MTTVLNVTTKLLPFIFSTVGGGSRMIRTNGLIIVLFYRGYRISSDNGVTWQSFSNNSISAAYNAWAFNDPTLGLVIFIDTNHGLSQMVKLVVNTNTATVLSLTVPSHFGAFVLRLFSFDGTSVYGVFNNASDSKSYVASANVTTGVVTLGVLTNGTNKNSALNFQSGFASEQWGYDFPLSVTDINSFTHFDGTNVFTGSIVCAGGTQNTDKYFTTSEFTLRVYGDLTWIANDHVNFVPVIADTYSGQVVIAGNKIVKLSQTGAPFQAYLYHADGSVEVCDMAFNGDYTTYTGYGFTFMLMTSIDSSTIYGFTDTASYLSTFSFATAPPAPPPIPGAFNKLKVMTMNNARWLQLK